jgi:hypothetical protein
VNAATKESLQYTVRKTEELVDQFNY